MVLWILFLMRNERCVEKAALRCVQLKSSSSKTSQAVAAVNPSVDAVISAVIYQCALSGRQIAESWLLSPRS